MTLKEKVARYKALVMKDATEGKLSAEETTEKDTLETELGASENEVIEETLEVDDEAANAIVERAMPALQKMVDGAVAKAAKAAKVISGAGEGEGKELKMVKFLKALRDGDVVTLKAMREGSDEDGGYLVPPAEFSAEVLRLEEEYGVAAAEANVRTLTKSNSYSVLKKTAGVSFYETTELQVKRTTGMQITQIVGVLRKFAAIAPVSDELDEDSAVNIWNELTRDFAIANAQLEDTIVFTDATSGILHDSDVPVFRVSTANINALDFYNDLGKIPYAIVKPARKGAKWFVHSTMVGIFTRMHDTNSNPLYKLSDPLWGYPVVETDVLPTPIVGLNKILGVFGNLKIAVDLVRKNQLALKMLDQATIGGRDGDTVIDLASQDAKALRAVVRLNAVVKFPNALVIIETPAAS